MRIYRIPRLFLTIPVNPQGERRVGLRGGDPVRKGFKRITSPGSERENYARNYKNTGLRTTARSSASGCFWVPLTQMLYLGQLEIQSRPPGQEGVKLRGKERRQGEERLGERRTTAYWLLLVRAGGEFSMTALRVQYLKRLNT